MEVFLQFFFTIVLSLILSFFISKLLSWDPTGHHVDLTMPSEHVTDKTTVSDCEIEENSRSSDTESKKKRVRFNDEVPIQEVVVDDGELDNDPVREDLEARSLDICGDGEEVGAEILRQVVVVGGVEEKFMEESVGDYCVTAIEDNLVDESPECTKLREIETELAKDEVSVEKNVVDDKERWSDDDDDDDDWEGIERTELEKRFGEAVAFVGCRSDSDFMSELGSDVQMELCGLHKVATEGPCHEPQPMAFKVSARAKWHSWQRLGNLSPEAAMEQYIKLLSQHIPGWLGDDSGGDSEQSFTDAGASTKLASDLEKVICNQTVAENERPNNEMHFKGGCA